MTDVAFGTVKAEEAISHLRAKVGVPTKRWDAMLGPAQAKAFTVAGATKADLLFDLHSAVLAALENGQSISQFLEGFDQVVANHGWSYRGSRGWRSRVIYDNNLRTAHMAGRWEQIQRSKARRPYLVYMTVGDKRVREEHRRWHAIALPVDDPWWDTHYPPNDFGCRCYVINATARDLQRMGIEVVEAPAIATSRRVNTRTGEDYGEVPDGIGTGWDYNVGKAWLAPDIAFGERLVQLPRVLRREVTARVSYGLMDEVFTGWAQRALADTGRGYVHTLGWLDDAVLGGLEDRGTPASTAAITIDDHRLRRMFRSTKQEREINLPESVLLALPRYLRDYRAVLVDKKSPGLVFVLPDIAGLGSRAGKVVIRFNFRERGETTNSVRSAGTVPAEALKNRGNYDVIAGEL